MPPPVSSRPMAGQAAQRRPLRRPGQRHLVDPGAALHRQQALTDPLFAADGAQQPGDEQAEAEQRRRAGAEQGGGHDSDRLIMPRMTRMPMSSRPMAAARTRWPPGSVNSIAT